MIRRVVVRRWYSIALVILTAAILLTGGFIIVLVLQDAQRVATAQVDPSPSSTGSSGVPAASPAAMSWVVIPDNADCGACHLTENGAIGLRPVPVIAHPLDGWSDCTACHSSARLVQTAPGHSGIHAGACLTCHQPGNLPAPLSRPHRELQNTACLDCHGSKAPLPTDMAHRGGTVCWLCHRLPVEQPPVPDHPVSAGQTDCLTCHVAGKVGALPQDHATRTPSECLLCHAPPADAPTPAVVGQPVRQD